MTRKQEDFLNRALSLLLKEHGVTTDYEQRAGRKRMDIVANVGGLRIVLEAERGFHRKSQAVKDSDARLKQGLTVAVFALCYPNEVTEENLGGATLTWTLRLKAGEPAEQWATGDAAALARAVQQAPDSLSGADIAAQKLSDALDATVKLLTANDCRSLAGATYQPPSPAPARKATPARATASPPNVAFWCWLPPCCFTTDCRGIYPYCGQWDTTGNGHRFLPPYVLSRAL